MKGEIRRMKKEIKENLEILKKMFKESFEKDVSLEEQQRIVDLGVNYEALLKKLEFLEGCLSEKRNN